MSSESMQLFSEACGATRPLLLEVERPGLPGTELRAFDQPFAVVGRTSSTDLALNDPTVSERHAYLQVIAGRIFGVDLHSRSGLLWDGRPQPCGWMEDGRALSIGPFQVRKQDQNGIGVRSEWSTPNPMAVIPPDLDPLPGIRLRLLNGASSKPWCWRMRRTLAFIGQSRRCRIRISGPAVAMMQCSLLRTAMGLWVVDLLGREVQVNGRPVRFALLGEGDELQVCNALFRVLYSPPSLRPMAAVATVSDYVAAPPEDCNAGMMYRNGNAEAGINGISRTRETRLRVPSHAFVDQGQDTAFPQSGLAVNHVETATQLSTREPALGRELAAALAPLATQFALMQQQMFDQFKQAMLMMGQMFSDLHREQLALIREELDRLHHVTQEIQTLQLELVRNPRPPVPETIERTSPVSHGASGGGPEEPANGSGHVPTNGACETNRLEPPAANAPILAGTGDLESADFHVLITQRIAALQEQRQGLWQKIVAYLKPKDQDVPP
jgi:hypothetical protein